MPASEAAAANNFGAAITYDITEPQSSRFLTVEI